MKVAVEGCCHGEIDATYKNLQDLEKRNGTKVDLLLICGDFQAIRDVADLQCMAVPNKYKVLGQFYKYYTGQKTAPVLTIVIGGNHEASNYMWELYHGGWLAPNIYFLGHAGCVRVNGIRIAGISGIFKEHDFRRGNFEQLPYNPSSIRSIYHMREFNVRRLSLLSQPTVFLSHDWPRSIEHHGNLRWLLRRKTYFEEDIKSARLGAPPLMGLLKTLKPAWWFSAHLHVKYWATVTHEAPTQEAVGSAGEPGNPDEIIIDEEDLSVSDLTSAPKAASPSSDPMPPPPKQNPDEITLEDEEGGVVSPTAVPPPATSHGLTQREDSVTRFLALDKCLPGRHFMELIEIAAPVQRVNQRPVLEFDPEWLAITRAFNPLFSTGFTQTPFPEEKEAREAVALARGWVTEYCQNNDPDKKLLIDDVQTFVRTAAGPVSATPDQRVRENLAQPPAFSNPQTEAFCRMLGIQNKINPAASGVSALK